MAPASGVRLSFWQVDYLGKYCAHLVPSVHVGRSSQYALMIIEFRKESTCIAPIWFRVYVWVVLVNTP